MKLRPLPIGSAVALLSILALSAAAMQAQQTRTKSPAPGLGSPAETTIPPAVLVQPEELARMLRSPEKPLILQVGSHVLYAEAHIPASEYAGAAGTSAGLETLRKRVSNLSKDKPIVIYCGCCPWGHCPNIRPAYRQLHALGFTHVRALYLADNFGTDWVDKGYPVVKGR